MNLDKGAFGCAWYPFCLASRALVRSRQQWNLQLPAHGVNPHAVGGPVIQAVGVLIENKIPQDNI